MPSPEMRTAEAERCAEMVAPLRDAFPLPPTDARFAERLAKLQGVGQPTSQPHED